MDTIDYALSMDTGQQNVCRAHPREERAMEKASVCLFHTV
jgi:hypothetical protein